jgi:hypothetical protein
MARKTPAKKRSVPVVGSGMPTHLAMPEVYEDLSPWLEFELAVIRLEHDLRAEEISMMKWGDMVSWAWVGS